MRKRNPKKKKTTTTEEEKNELSSLYEDLVAETVANVSNDSDSGTSGHRYSNDGQISETVENNRIIDLTNADENREENIEMQFSSLLEDSSCDSEDNILNPLVNKRLATNNVDGELNSDSNFINSENNETKKTSGWNFKKPRITKNLNDNNIQELDKLLESIHDDEELKDISLNTTNESVDSNPSKGT